MKIFVLIFAVIFLLIQGCQHPSDDGDFVFLSHQGADVPVWVRGNLDAEVFLIYIHGGPGGSSFIDIQHEYLGEIESRYAIAYYDQRASGNSIGKSADELLTLDQFIQDLDMVVEYVEATYSPEKIVLLGHSWGGTLGTAYLLEAELRAKIDAWIEVDGGHNIGQRAFEYSRDYVLSVADSLIENGTTKEQKAWQTVRQYYEDKNSWRDMEVVIQHSKFVSAAGGYFYDAEKVGTVVGAQQILFSETDFWALLRQNEHVILNMDIWHLDFTDRLGEIDIPTLLLWGRTDGILPLELAYEAKTVMELDETQFYIFKQSAHSPHYEETELFNQKVIEFIQQEVE